MAQQLYEQSDWNFAALWNLSDVQHMFLQIVYKVVEDKYNIQVDNCLGSTSDMYAIVSADPTACSIRKTAITLSRLCVQVVSFLHHRRVLYLCNDICIVFASNIVIILYIYVCLFTHVSECCQSFSFIPSENYICIGQYPMSTWKSLSKYNSSMKVAYNSLFQWGNKYRNLALQVGGVSNLRQ
jgi:hypothetical protein